MAPKRKASTLLQPIPSPESLSAPSLPDAPVNAAKSKGKKVARTAAGQKRTLQHVAVPAEDATIKAEDDPESPLSEPPEVTMPAPKAKRGKNATETPVVKEEGAPAMPTKSSEDADALRDPEAEVEEEANEDEVREALSKPPPVNSPYLPLPWKGRLGYACLNTYLRYSTPPVFSSRTCRIASILEHRHPLQDPSQPEHATKNRPDRSQPADIARGKKYVEDICLANVRDIAKMIRWNEKYGIRFMRLSSEMFPFASHEEYGYKLTEFAAHDLAEAGKVIAQYGHRVTTHPGQFTQLGSPRKSVTDNAVRDLDYHDEMLSLLKLPEQQDRDAVMIVHMGGVFGDKAATLDRFRAVYAGLSDSVKRRLVLENDDVSYSVHDLLPICEELNIPFVLDFHHHNIIFDDTQLREGSADIVNLYPRILATWQRKGITPKMHYSEPCPGAITGRQRRKHRPRVATLPPCPDTMDLMIEAKDKEQAVFELMRTFRLPGFETINDIIPYSRADDNKLAQQELDKRRRALASRKAKAAKKGEELAEHEGDITAELIPEEDVGMGGPEGRVYWPPGMEEWLRPKKREVKPKPAAPATPAKKVKKEAEEEEEDSDPDATPATKKAKAMLKQRARAKAEAANAAAAEEEAGADVQPAQKPVRKAPPKKRAKKEVMTPSSSEEDSEEMPVSTGRKSARGGAKKRVSYAEEEMEE